MTVVLLMQIYSTISSEQNTDFTVYSKCHNKYVTLYTFSCLNTDVVLRAPDINLLNPLNCDTCNDKYLFYNTYRKISGENVMILQKLRINTIIPVYMR